MPALWRLPFRAATAHFTSRPPTATARKRSSACSSSAPAAGVARDALRRVVAAQELERRRLARELHDQTGQELTSVILGLKAVEEAQDPASHAEALEQVRAQVVETLHDVRRLAVELRP